MDSKELEARATAEQAAKEEVRTCGSEPTTTLSMEQTCKKQARNEQDPIIKQKPATRKKQIWRKPRSKPGSK